MADGARQSTDAALDTSDAAHDSTGATQQTLLNVTESPYNADPTDASDDSAAIQQACDDAQPGEAVYIPAVPDKAGGDKYLLDPSGENGIVLDETHSGIDIRGDGAESYLEFAGGQSANYRGIKFDAGSNDITDITIESIWLDGNKANNGGAPNGWGIIFFANDAANPADDNLLVQGCWTTNWITTGIEVSRGAKVAFCTSDDNGAHGFATAFAENNTNINRLEDIQTSGNGIYGIDFHGRGKATRFRSVNDEYGFKSSTDFGVTDGSNQVHEISNAKVEGANVFGYQSTNTITSMTFTDVWVDDIGGWGFRLSEDADYIIRGNGIKATNVDNSRDDGGAIRIGGADVTVVDEAQVVSQCRVKDVQTSGGGDAIRIVNTSAGVVDELIYDSATVGTAVNDAGGCDVASTTDKTDVGNINFPALSAVGADAFN